jgi:hypothetical protein
MMRLAALPETNDLIASDAIGNNQAGKVVSGKVVSGKQTFDFERRKSPKER